MFKPYTYAYFALLIFSAPATVEAQNAPSELIILLPEEADPVAVVYQLNNDLLPPYGLDLGSPISARLVLPDRPVGRTLQWILTNPSSALATLYRYIVLEYPVPTDTTALMATLQAGGELPSVEPNLFFKLSGTAPEVIPDDPFFGTLLGDPTFSQWAFHIMRFPAAWDWAKGHAQIGVVDQGIEVDHPELLDYFRASAAGPWVWRGGSVRSQRSFTVVPPPASPNSAECDYDELDSGDLYAGHGTHVAGLIGAHTDNGEGVAGACWGCSLQIGKAFENQASAVAAVEDAGKAAVRLVNQGVQALSFSFGIERASYPSCDPDSEAFMCKLLRLISERHLFVAASSGNDRTVVEFPASEPTVVGVGGVQRTFTPPYYELWDEASCPRPGGIECGANYGDGLDLVAPAKTVLSTLYTNKNHNAELICGDAPGLPGIPNDGLGVCTGTSMATPLVVGLAGILRSVSPMLTHFEIADILTSTATLASNRTNTLGYGLPLADAAVVRALGQTHGQPIANRLTPLFSLKSTTHAVHFYTPAPQEAAALTLDPEDPFDSFGTEVSGYSLPGACTTGPCPPNPATASFYVFTSTREPYAGAPPLYPLYRLRYDPNHAALCRDQIRPLLSTRRFAYALSAAEIEHFRNATVDSQGVGYEADGILGWVYPWCEPYLSCRPQGTVALYRLYSATRDDWALVIEPDRANYEADGYHTTPQVFGGVGFVYANTDTDNDRLIDGWEGLLGTNPANADTDCDALSDGFEVRGYRFTGPPENHGYRDPLDGPCFPFFSDGFETGNTSRWSFTLFVDDGIGF